MFKMFVVGVGGVGLLAGCSGGDSGGGTGSGNGNGNGNSPIVAEAKAEAKYGEQQLDFGATEPIVIAAGSLKEGEYVDAKITLKNTAALAAYKALEIAAIDFQYEAKSGDESEGNLAFSCLTDVGAGAEASKGTPCLERTDWPKIVPGGAKEIGNGGVTEFEFTVRYKRFKDTIPRIATLVIDLAGDPKSKRLQVKFSTNLGAPKLYTDPDTLYHFDFVQKGEKASGEFQIQNVGEAPLVIDKITLVGPSLFGMTSDAVPGKTFKGNESIVFDPPLSKTGGEGFTVTLTYSPEVEAVQEGLLVVYTNDPKFPAGKEIKLLSSAGGPCAKLVPSNKVGFGAVVLGKQAERPVKVQSCGDAELHVSSIALAPDSAASFAMNFKDMVASKQGAGMDPLIGPTTDLPLKLKINEDNSFVVTCTPASESPTDPTTQQKIPDVGKIVVLSNAFTEKIELPVECIGVIKDCPTATVSVQEGESVIPQTTLHLVGDKSSASAGGAIKKYKWKVKQPPGSNQPFVPGPNHPNPQFTANAAGSYEFCLDVFDENDTPSCEPACITINVIPDQALHVELLWNTPADSDETDTGPDAGSDLDLHFAHPLATGKDLDCDGKGDPWFNAPFDCFWFNSKPNWGSFNPTANDDPGLDLDDTDGAGPENMNLNAPENKKTYSVGVHYWNDHGFGDSYAQVNVYVYGALMLSISDVLMKPLDMWYAGTIYWDPSNPTGPADITICQQDKPPCDGGKMWQKQGEYCITPCYINQAFAASMGVKQTCGK